MMTAFSTLPHDGPVDAPKYPNIVVELSVQDGNGYAILARVSRALRRGGVNADDVAEFAKQALSGDYEHLLDVVNQWVEVQ